MTNLKKERPRFFLFLLMLALAVSFATYGWVIFGGFFFSDDFTWLWHGRKVGWSLANILDFRMSTFYSPVMNAFWAAMYPAFGYDPQPFFLADLLVHALASFLAGVLAWQLGRKRLLAGTVTVLMALGGAAYEPMIWAAANMHPFMAAFVLACLVFYCWHLSSKKSLPLLGSFLFLILALGTKESAIIAPALLFGAHAYHWLGTREKIRVPAMIFWAGTVLFSGAYLYQQYLWQKSSVWVSEGIWSINHTAFLRIPLAMADNFVPTRFLVPHLSSSTAWLFWGAAAILVVLLAYGLRRLRLAWLGFFWMLVAISPFIFFRTALWWEPLASRYNYLPRLGAALILAAILQHFLQKGRNRYLSGAVACLVVAAVAGQVYFMAHTVSQKYDYVYASGRTLVAAMEEARVAAPDELLVRWDHPFTNNNAHIVGAASVVADIPEEEIVFLKKGDEEDLTGGRALLYWDAPHKKYELKRGN